MISIFPPIRKMEIRYVNEQGQLHRVDGLPALILPTGTKCWYVDGELHREPLGVNPSGINPSGATGVNPQGATGVNPQGVNELSAIEFANGNKVWFIRGELHRGGDLPACESVDGDKEWWFNGKRHRELLPAIECANGGKDWYVHGVFQRKEAKLVDETIGLVVNYTIINMGDDIYRVSADAKFDGGHLQFCIEISETEIKMIDYCTSLKNGAGDILKYFKSLIERVLSECADGTFQEDIISKTLIAFFEDF